MKKVVALLLTIAMLLTPVLSMAEEGATAKKILDGKEYEVDYISLYDQFGANASIADVTEDEATGLSYITIDGQEYELGLDFLTMAMVYNTQVPEGGRWATEDDVYTTWYKLYIQRWNYLLPEVPLYSRRSKG